MATGAHTIPAEWRAGVARLKRMGPPVDWPPMAWLRLEAALPGFMSTWAPEAAALEWSTLDLFGCHPQAPYARLDLQGLALGLQACSIITIDERAATVVFCTLRHGNRMTWRRRPPEVLADAVPLWELAPAGDRRQPG